MAEAQCIRDNRPQLLAVLDGVQRRYFELNTFNHQSVAKHIQDGNEMACKVYLPQDPRCTKEIIENMPAYKNWLTQLLQNLALQSRPKHVFHNNQYKLKSIDLQGPTWFPTEASPGKLGFVKAQCVLEADHLENGNRPWLPGAVFLRGGSVGVLIIIQPYDEEEQELAKLKQDQQPELYSILTIQPRIAAGSLAFAELPAGMLDDSGDLGGKASNEIKEEVGMTINKSELFNMSEAAVNGIYQRPVQIFDADEHCREIVRDSMYPSPGGCDEFLPLMLLQKRLRRDEITSLQSRNTGLKDEGEVITLKIVPFQDLWREGGRDAKCLAALGLYENLKRVGGILPSMPARPDDKRKP